MTRESADCACDGDPAAKVTEASAISPIRIRFATVSLSLHRSVLWCLFSSVNLLQVHKKCSSKLAQRARFSKSDARAAVILPAEVTGSKRGGMLCSFSTRIPERGAIRLEGNRLED
jgi:hypothetical protein